MASKRAALIDLAKARAASPDTPRLVDPGPICQWAGCGKPLVKVRPHQKYCNDRCRYQAWIQAGGRRR